MKRSRIHSVLYLLISVILLAGTVFASDLIPVESDYVANPLYEMYSMQEIEQAPILFAGGSDQPAYEDYPKDIDSVVTELRQGMVGRENVITLYYATVDQLVKADLNVIFEEALLETDMPYEGDYLRWSWKNYGGQIGGVRFGGVNYYTITFTVNYYTTAQEELVVEKKINELISEFAFDETDTDYQKIKTVYDYLCENVSYDYDGFYTLTDSDTENNDYSIVTAHKALTQGKAVCQGYATLFYRMVETLGIDARLIPGYSRNQGHAWNIVKIGDYYYNLDTTWDAGMSAYNYFLRSQEVFDSGHVRYAEFDTDSFHTVYPMGEDYQTTLCDLSGHQFTAIVTPPSCTEEGYTTHSCTVCLDSYTSDHTAVVPHSFTSYVSDHNATCLSDGTKTATCIREGCTETKTIPDVGSATGHSYENKAIDPGCTEQGYKIYICSCGDSYKTDYVGAKGHTEVIDKAVASTCTETGLTEGKHCSVCNTVLSKQEVVSAKGHTEVTDKTVAATCLETGLTEGKHCSDCNTVIVKQETVAKLPHKWDEGKTTKTPTAEKTGVKTFTCTVCKTTKTEEIPALGICDGKDDCPLKKFDDVNNTHWAHPGMDFAVNNGLMNGTGDGTTFAPEISMSRAMLVTVLWRYSGSPVAPVCSFKDVSKTDWFYKAVAWAASEGVVNGVGDGTSFDPDGNVTREMMATILYRYAKMIGVDVSASASIFSYPDADSVASWSSDAVKWAVAEGIISGAVKNGNTVLAPQDSANRAVVATIMMRFIQNVVE